MENDDLIRRIEILEKKVENLLTKKRRRRRSRGDDAPSPYDLSAIGKLRKTFIHKRKRNE